MVQSPTSKMISRLVDGQICAYALTPESWGLLSPLAVFRPSSEDRVVEHAVFADGKRAVYTTLNAAVCVTDTGDEVWRYAFEPQSDQVHGHRPGCVLSADEKVVWVYRPDAMAGRDRPDQWIALDASIGELLGQQDLETVGHSGQHLTHPSDGHVLLDVGEGQDGTVIYRALLTAGGISLDRYPWDDRCLIDLAPDGGRFLTVGHDQADAAIHAYPGGEVLLELPVEAFLPIEDVTDETPEFYLEWAGGFLTPDSVVVVLTGETEDDPEWSRSYRVDLRTGEIEARFDGHNEHPYDLQPLGDASWLTTDPAGHPIRWSQP
ncbi:hypothetical protein DZF91_10620 [Actinomadura logoneensis]|uniref:PQQ-binding-like beta-propeller repeat protein n=1 Tax=Actinomadura logoneensis TaxID=2293572 RepID=A0A372JNM3_9ACTN|nr:hypothetical protein [Actinomadura logoneensis]RFU41623.1 hypothetical protein DZF91_10620 [Actinomadura logoneensis]